MAGARKALVVATYDYRDAGLRRLAAPEHDAESFAAVLEDPDVAGFDVTTLVNEPHHVVGEAIADFYAGCRRDDLALLYFSGHGLKDDEGRLHLAMSNTRREALLFTAISAAQLNDAMEASASRRKVLILDCCYSGAFPAGRAAKSDEGVQTLERFQGKGRAVLTASDATQYAFEGDSLTGAGSSSVFTRYLVEAIRSGAADLDEDGDIALDELYSYVRERVVAEMPQQRPKKQEDVDGRILIARNVHWTLPAHLRHAIESPIAAQRLSAVDGLGHLHRVGNDLVRTVVAERIAVLADDDSRSVSAAATALAERIRPETPAHSLPDDGGVRAAHAEPDRAGIAPAVLRAIADRQPAAQDDLAEWPAAAPGPQEAPAAREVPAPQGVPAVQETPAAQETPLRGEVAERPAGPPASNLREEPETDAPALDRVRPHAPLSAPAPAPAEPPTERPDVPMPVLLGLLGAGAVCLTVSRYLVYEASSGYTALELGWLTAPWVLGVTLPLLGAVALLLGRTRLPWALPLASGLVAGTAVVVIDKGLHTANQTRDTLYGHELGPGFWFLLLGATALVGFLVLVARRGHYLDRPPVNRSGRAGVAAAAVVAAFLAHVVVIPADGSGLGWWLQAHLGPLLLSVLCLVVISGRLNAVQRVAGLAAVIVFALWELGWVFALLESDDDDASRFFLVSLMGPMVSVGACFLAHAGPRPEPAPAEPVSAEKVRIEGRTAGRSLPLLLTLIVGAGVLLLLSRSLVFDASSGLHAVDADLETLPWVLCVGLPVLAAALLLITRGSTAWAFALAAGLVTGAALSLLDQSLAWSAYAFGADKGGSPGPGWWSSVVGTAVLLVCMGIMAAEPVLRARPALRRDWPGIVAGSVVVAALVAWLYAGREAWYWFSFNEPALMLAAVCFPVAVLRLNPAQRLAGLAAVTILGPWVAASHIRDVMQQSFRLDSNAAVVALAAIACTLAACYLVQFTPRPQVERPAAEGAGRR